MDSSQRNLAPSSPSDAVKVSVRVRPLNAREQAALSGSKVSWAIDDSSITQCVNSKLIAANSFTFDHVFQQGVANEQIFTDLAKPVVSSATDGINGVIFAYGQTAAGKTYTMLGTDQDPGITRRSIAEVFRIISACPNRQFLLRASYIEIYNEVIRDLLMPDNDNLKIHEDVINKRVFVDSREEVVTSVGQVMDIIAAGEKLRAVGETNMNDRSSRSHTIFSLKVESREMSAAEADGEELGADEGVAVRASTLSLVDLAGSERASFTKAQGMRLIEGGHINKSLLTLGTVINKLSSGEARSYAHIPFRDSKLTRLLQPALGGNARTAIVCAVTPAILHMEETLSTLKFASRAKKVTNQAKTNEFLDDRAKLRRAEKEIARLNAECKRLKADRRSDASKGTRFSSTEESSLEERKSRRVSFEKKFNALLKALQERKIKFDVRQQRMEHDGTIRPLRPIDALDLFYTSQCSSSGTKVFDTNVEEELDELRKRTFEAEREKRQAFAEIKYERQAMIAEVEVLLATSEEAERARIAAEHECAEANSKLAQKLAASMVGEIVTEAVTTSLVSTELKEAKKHLHKLRSVHQENDLLKSGLSSLRKEHAETVKREKRGVGPVLKQVKFLEGKVSDLEKKLKTLRQTSSQNSSEKASIERELKSVQRQNKVLTGEVTKHRNHVAKGQARANRELEDEKKKIENSLEILQCDMSKLVKANREKEEKIASANLQLTKMRTEVDEVRRSRDDLLQETAIAADKYDRLSQELQESNHSTKRLEEEVQRLQHSGNSVADEITELTEELGKAHIEIEELKTELSRAAEDAECAKKGRNEMISENGVISNKLSAIVETKARNDALLVEKETVQKNLEQDLERKESLLSQLSEKIKSLEEDIVENANLQNSTKDALGKITEESEDLRNRLEAVESMNDELRRENCTECAEHLRRLHSLEKTLHEMEKGNQQISNGTRNLQDGALSSLKKENQLLQTEVEKLVLETKTRTREILKLSEAIQSRDRKIYTIEDTLDQLGRGEGKIAALEQRCHRRDLMIGELNRRLELQERILDEGGLPDSFKDYERILELESKYAAIVLDQNEREQLIQRLEAERMALVEESRKLRDIIKDRDIRRVRDAAKKKDAQHDEVRRKRDVLRSLPANGASG